MTSVANDLADLGAAVSWPSAETAATARAADLGHIGRLAEVVEWLASAQGAFPPTAPLRPRCAVIGEVPPAVEALAAALDAGVRAVELEPDWDVATAVAAGSALADLEVDSGTDLLVVADPQVSPAAAVIVSLFTGAEPTALLPRGAAATDTAEWIATARTLRDTRRAVARLRSDPGGLLEALDHPRLAALVGMILRAVARRTAVVLDGTSAVVAGLVCHDVQSRTGRWIRIADTCPDPVHTRAAEEMLQRPLLDLATSTGDGTAGLLTIPMLRSAALLGSGESHG